MPAVKGFEFDMVAGRKSQRVETSPFVMMVLGDFGGIAQSFTEAGWDMSPGDNTDVGGLPVFAFEEDDEKKMLPCAELLLPERTAEAILGPGVMPVVSFRNRDMARLLRFQSNSEPLSALQVPGTEWVEQKSTRNTG